MKSMMKQSKMKIEFLLLSMATLISACQSKKTTDSRVDTLPYYNEATFTPHWLSPDDPVLDTFHSIPPFTLIDQDGDTITEKTFEGKIYVADFFFTTCPGICPKMTANMGILQEEFLDDEDVLLLSHSVTPDYDSAAVLKLYAEAKGVISGKWYLATGNRDEIYRLGRRANFIEEDLGLQKEEDEFLHTENFVLVDKYRHIRGIYNGLNKASIQQLITDIQTLKKEKSSSLAKK